MRLALHLGGFLTFLIVLSFLGRTGGKYTWTKELELGCRHICECVQSSAQCSNRGIANFAVFKGGNLTAVDLSKNALSHLTRETFQLNRDVEVINLAENSLVTLPAVLFKGLSLLVSVNVSFNKLVYAELPQKLFYESLNLRMLSMNNQGQRQTGVPPGFLDPLSSLEELHMTGVPALNMSVSTASNLRLLNLGDLWCNISVASIENYPFINCSSKLSVVSLRYCLVEKMELDFLAGMNSLKRLDVSCNPGLSPYLIPAFDHLNSGLEVLLADMISDSSHYVKADGKRVFYNGFNIHDILRNTPKLLALSLKQNYFLHNETTSIHTYVPLLRQILLDGETDRLSSLENEQRSTTALLHLGLDVFLIENLLTFDMEQFRVRGNFYDYSICSSPNPLITEKNYPWQRDEINIVRCDRQCREDLRKRLVSALNSGFVIPRQMIKQLYNFTSVTELIVRYSQFPFDHIISCSYDYTIHFEKVDFSFSHALDNAIYSTPGCILSAPALRQFFCRGCSLTTISSNFFHHFPIMVQLDFSINKLGRLLATNTSMVELFKQSSRLELLDLSSNAIYKLPKEMFKFTFNLRVLNLSDNSMDSWDLDLTNCKQLDVLDLSQNLLKSISPSAFNYLPLDKFLSLDLSGNHFDCRCTEESLEFFQWLTSPPQTRYVDYTGDYVCSDRHLSLSAWAIHESKTECNEMAHIWLEIVIVTLTTIVILSSLAFVCYLKRFSLSYKAYRVSRFLHQKNLNITECVKTVQKYNLSVYLAVDELEEMWQFFVDKGIRFQSRNNVSKATGSRWENVCHDIDSADLVIVTLSDGCLTDEEASADFYFAFEKGVDRTVTITKGDFESLRKGWSWRQKLVNRLLKHSKVVKWPCGELGGTFLHYFERTLLERKCDKAGNEAT